jgi:hypothetical protein
MDPINIPQMLAYIIPAPWIPWVLVLKCRGVYICIGRIWHNSCWEHIRTYTMHEPYVVSPFGAPIWLGYTNEVAPAKQFQALCHFVFTDLTLTVDTCPINQPASHVIISHYQIDQIICRSADTPRSGRFTQVANRLGHFVSTEITINHIFQP